MNLIPIDSGGTPTDLVGRDASPAGDFAALMTGLMAGDTQIVPLIDIPSGGQLPEGAEAQASDETAEVAGSILEFIGTPPRGLTVSPQLAEAASNAPSADPEQSVAPTQSIDSTEATGIEGEPVASTPAVLDSKGANPQPDPTIGQADGPALATVHPISNHVAYETAPAGESATSVAGLVDNERAGQQPVAPQVRTETAPQTAVTPTESRPTEASAAPAGADSSTTPFASPNTPDVPTQSLPTERVKPQVSESEPTVTDGHATQSDVELDTGATSRPLETARPAGAIPKAAMVGIARRVEEAIAALATKPDPKIVTLQLDELDGLRLTVALRPDGLHLSSSGDAALTTEIERALATRGFDMASTGEESGQNPEEHAEDGWRPQSAPAAPRRTTNPSGIRL